jgi:ATP-binding cassette, subfamily C, bacterial CydCD
VRVDPRLLRAVPSLRAVLAVLAALQVVGALLTLAQAGLLADLIVAIFLHGAHGSSLVLRLVLLAAVGVGRACLAAVQECLTARYSVRMRAALRRRVLDAVARLGPGWTARQPAGRLVTAAGPGLEGLDGYVTRALPALVSAAVVPVIVLARIGLADWQSLVVLLLALPLVPLFMVLIGITTRRHMDRRYAALARMAGQFLDLVQGLTTLKVYGQVRRQVATVRRSTDEYRMRTMSTLRVAFLSGLVLDLIATLSVAVVAVDVGLRLDHSRVGLSTALLVLLLAPEVFAPLRAMGAQHHAATEGTVAAAAALDVLDEAGEPVPSGVVSPDGSVTLTGLRLRYPGRSTPALSAVDLTVAPGEVLAVQGVSGAGKSSLLAALLRFVPHDGTIARAHRADVAWVPQRPRPTQPTVAAEVALGDPGASPEQIAMVVADCHAPHPDTPLGEDGTQISAGQRRRVALARALLRAQRVRDTGHVPLVLLDEPSEDLDHDTERVVATVIGSLAGWATVIMVTHSLRLAAITDRRVVLDHGRVIADQRQLPVHAAPVPPDRATSGGPTRPDVAQYGGRSLRLPGAPRRLLAAALLGGGSGLAGLALTATSLWLICRAAQHPNVQALAVAVVGVRAFALARALLRYAERLVSHDAALRLLADLRARVFAALEPLGLAGFRRGDLLRRFVSDVDGVQEGLVRAVLPTAAALLTAAGAAVLAGLLAPAAGIVLALALVLAGVGVPALVRGLAGDASALARAAGVRDARLTGTVDGLAELTAYGAEQDAIAGVARADQAVAVAARRPAAAAALGAFLAGGLAAVALPAVLAAGAAAASGGRLAPVSVAVLAACVLAGFDALAPLPAAYAAWSRYRAGWQRVADVLAAPAPVPEPHQPLAAPSGQVGLRAAALTLAPAPGAPAILRGADLDVRPGQRVALTGPSGCGKTTLLAAALRLLTPRHGRVELGSRPLLALAAADVPPLVAGSLQGDHVFNTTLRDNLRVVRPEATDAELDEVAARAGLADFAHTLPYGWSSPAGPDGAALSGGQRQRLLLARALLANPRILVLDEPTAHLDTDTERAVLRDLLAGTRGRTVLLSTHRHIEPGQLDQVVRIGAANEVPA